MPRLDPAVEERVRAEAKKRGVDPDAAVKHAESVAKAKSDVAESPEPSGESGGPATSTGLVVDQLLIGHLPFITVKELRTLLGFGPITDDHLTCGQFQAKYAGSLTASTAAAPNGPPTEAT